MLTRLRCKSCFHITKFDGKLKSLKNFKYSIVQEVTTSKKSAKTGKVTKSTKSATSDVTCPFCKEDRFEFIGEV